MEFVLTFTLNRSITAAASVAAVAAMTLTACGGGDTTAQAPVATSSTTTSSAVAAPSTSSSSSSSASSSSTSTAAPTRAAQPQVARSQARPTLKVSSYTRALGFGTVRHTDSSLAKGSAKVTTQGVAGLQRVTVTTTVVGGKVTRTVITKRETVKAPVTKVITVGTKVVAPKTTTPKRTTSAPSTGGLDLRRAAMWDRIAQCESTGNWSINSGNGYYGGLQFDIGTWLGAGGGRFAPRADLASRAQQITIANKVYDSRGLGPWGCAHAA